MHYQVVRLSDRPALQEQIQQLHREVWPEFLHHTTGIPFEELYSTFADYQLLLCQAEGEVVALAQTIPLHWDGSRADLPEDFVELFERAIQCRRTGRAANALSAIAGVVAPSHQRRGISASVVGVMIELAARCRCDNLIAPVRPRMKEKYPLIPMEQYADWKRVDGSPFDYWLRVHWRLGGVRLQVAPTAMMVQGRAAQWEHWTGMEFPETGNYVVPGALQPVAIDRESDLGTYYDPNVWVQHSVPAG